MPLIRSTAVETGSRSGPAAPLPSNASTIRLAGERRARSSSSSCGLGATYRSSEPAEVMAWSTVQLCAAAWPPAPTLEASPASTTTTRRPTAARRRATTKPSPPLLPGPQNTTVSGGSASAPPGPWAGSASCPSSVSATSVTAAPAPSIRASCDRPSRWAAASISAISVPPIRTGTCRTGRAAGSVIPASGGSRRWPRSPPGRAAPRRAACPCGRAPGPPDRCHRSTGWPSRRGDRRTGPAGSRWSGHRPGRAGWVRRPRSGRRRDRPGSRPRR